MLLAIDHVPDQNLGLPAWYPLIFKDGSRALNKLREVRIQDGQQAFDWEGPRGLLFQSEL